MTFDGVQRSAFDEVDAVERAVDGTYGVELVELPERSYLNLRCYSADPGVLAVVREVLGVELPTANKVARAGSLVTCWLGPDEWLVMGDEETVSSLAERMAAALGDRFHALTDLSGALVALGVSGSSVLDVLQQGTTLDLHPDRLGVDDCAQGVLAKTNALFLRTDSGFELVVRRSFADYLLRFLLDAAHDYGFRWTASEHGASEQG